MSDDPIAFEVRGEPAPQGSLRARAVGKFAKAYHQSNPTLQAWRTAVASAAQPHAPADLWDGPVAIRLDFAVLRPASVPTHRGRGSARHPVRSWPARAPDLDKYVRAVLDALTQVVWKDDGQVVEIRATKDYGTPGVRVEVRRVFEPAPIV